VTTENYLYYDLLPTPFIFFSKSTKINLPPFLIIANSAYGASNVYTNAAAQRTNHIINNFVFNLYA